jgi:DNA polymerase-1
LGEHLVFDLESDGLLDHVTKVHCLQLGNVDTDEVTLYLRDDAPPQFWPAWTPHTELGLQREVRPMAEGLERLRAAERAVGHNLIGYDLPVMERYFPGVITLGQCWDTMIAARLLNPEERSNTLKSWGERLGLLKGDYRGDFSEIDRELLVYAEQDVVVTRALYHKLRKSLAPMKKADAVLDVEHRFAHIIHLQERNGFMLDVPGAEALAAEFRQELADIEAQLQIAFPPITHRVTKVAGASNKKLGRVKGQPYVQEVVEVFNPGSRPQIGKRLMKLGWKPNKFTATGVPEVSETLLKAMPWPEAKLLDTYLTVAKKLGQIADGATGWLKVVKPTGRVHGRVNTIGCAPGRCTHNAPNMAQVNKKDKRMRRVWRARPDWVLVGCDGEGLQARIFAHYLARYDGGAFAKRVSEGKKADRSDVHSVNLKSLSLANTILVPLDADDKLWDKGRDGAKRCLYACWFGGGDPKLGWTAKDGGKNAGLPTPKMKDQLLGKAVRAALMRAIKGFEPLSKDIQAAAKARGYLISPLGRHIPIRSPHSALVFLMQAGEADVMKLAAVLFHFEECPAAGWEHGWDFAYCANVHDEVQIECRAELAEPLGAAFARCVTKAGVMLGLRCPLAGDHKAGPTWADTH